jgi:peptidase E
MNFKQAIPQKILRTIIAMGGGGFSMEPENPLLDEFILSESQKTCLRTHPRVCFLGTASGDSEGYIENFYTAFKKLPCEPHHLALFHGEIPLNLSSYLLSMDIIYVGGGSTRNLLVLWKEWGIDVLLKEAWEKGIILAGLSAGSLCWFEEGVTDSNAGELSALTCLGFLSGSHCPHYDGEVNRRPAYHRLISEGMKNGYAADDSAALVFKDNCLERVVSSQKNAKGYSVHLEGNKIVEEVLPTDFLG